MVVISIQTNSWDYEVLHEETLPGTHYPFTLTVKMPEKWLSSTSGKSDKK